MLCHHQGAIQHQPPPPIEAGLTLHELQELLSLFLEPAAQTISNSGSAGSSGRSSGSMDDRKRRRMISNRDSARRSRLRKKQKQEELTVLLNRLRVENRELENRLNQTTSRCYLVRRENERLSSECITLATRLSDLYGISISIENESAVIAMHRN
ncbi:hypothetical protein SAY86_000799 [Trapa natans]|uniref:BZIP domain-containing protein n=1 Tax=Trapa natans TaxID=22666 RepID=A0AAN7MZJ8_TRANT|nr:hypothetical protein SAY86_000799 [Trapa natans]